MTTNVPCRHLMILLRGNSPLNPLAAVQKVFYFNFTKEFHESHVPCYAKWPTNVTGKSKPRKSADPPAESWHGPLRKITNKYNRNSKPRKNSGSPWPPSAESWHRPLRKKINKCQRYNEPRKLADPPAAFGGILAWTITQNDQQILLIQQT